MKKVLVTLILFLALDAALCHFFLPDLFQFEVSAILTPAEEPTLTEYVVTTETAEEILALAKHPSLLKIDATQSREYDALLQLRKLLPSCNIRWVYEFQGQFYPSDTIFLRVTDLDGLEDAIHCLPKLKKIDLIETDATIEDLDRYDAIRPGIDYVWSFRIDGFLIRTDIQVYSSQRDGTIRRLSDKDLYPLLKYCRHLRALDLAHNDVTDVSLIGELSELEALVLSDNPFTDASPLGKLSNLRYLEMAMCSKVSDFGFLYGMTKLQDLNICYANDCTSLGFLENMPDFSFGIFKYTGVSQAEFLEWSERMPEANMVYWDGDYDSFSSGWRNIDHYRQITYAFSHWRNVTLYRSIDDIEYDTD